MASFQDQVANAAEGRMNQAPSSSVLRDVPLATTTFRLARKRTVPASTLADDLAHVPSQDFAATAEAERQGFERGRADGYGDGVRAGQEEGLRQGLQEAADQGRKLAAQAVLDATQALRATQAQLHRLELGLRPAFAACVAAAEDELVALCYESICSVLGEHALQPSVVQAHVKHVLARTGGGESITLHLHPQDLELLARCRLGADGPSAAGIRCVADADVGLGGCIVRTERGGLDARLETALLACKEALASARKNHQQQRDVGTEEAT